MLSSARQAVSSGRGSSGVVGGLLASGGELFVGLRDGLPRSARDVLWPGASGINCPGACGMFCAQVTGWFLDRTKCGGCPRDG